MNVKHNFSGKCFNRQIVCEIVTHISTRLSFELISDGVIGKYAGIESYSLGFKYQLALSFSCYLVLYFYGNFLRRLSGSPWNFNVSMYIKHNFSGRSKAFG